MAVKFSGLGVAMITPFNSKGDVDYDATQRLVEHLIAGGANFLLALGTTGEAVTQTESEKVAFVKHVVKCNNGRLPIVVGVGGNNTSKVIEDLGVFSIEGIDAVLTVTPFYNKPTQKGLELHYREVAKHSKLPIIMYNVPGRTGVNMNAETTLRLANEVPNITGIKEASGNLNQMGYILRNRPAGFCVLSGDDGLLLPQLAIGADGVISVVGNALPRQFSQMIALAKQGNYTDARKIHLNLIALIDMLFAEGNPGGIKAAMSIIGISQNMVRLPLAPISDSLYQKMKAEIDRICGC